MKRNFKQWQTFYNSNGYLSLVHKTARGKAQVINYNCSFYSLQISNEESSKYSKSIITPDEFFKSFPVSYFHSPEDKHRYENIKHRYYLENKETLNLLLLC